MCRLRQSTAIACVLAVLLPLPATAQISNNSQALVVYRDPTTLASLDEVSLHDRLKGLKSGRRNIDFGGQFRLRYHREDNLRNSTAVPNSRGLTGADDDFLLYRTRLWVNATVNKRVRAYFELLDAESNLEDLAPRASDVDRLDIHCPCRELFRTSLTVVASAMNSLASLSKPSISSSLTFFWLVAFSSGRMAAASPAWIAARTWLATVIAGCSLLAASLLSWSPSLS